MRVIFFIFLLISCEDIIYGKYRIIKGDFKNNNIFYEVKKGDNIYSISRKKNISVREIIEANYIQAPYKIFPKQKLFLPVSKIHQVKKGETLYSISRKYNTDIYQISLRNKILDVNEIIIGQKLFIPSTKKKIRPESPKNEKKTIKKNDYKKKTKSSKNKKIEYNTKFKWPLKGNVISKFGSNKPGFHNDGINISSNTGNEVLAAKDGRVIYIGNEIPGYGNLILLKHSKNWITAYAHLKKIKLEKGSIVKQGEISGVVGNTGSVKEPQLHFEIRKGKIAVDPLNFLS